MPKHRRERKFRDEAARRRRWMYDIGKTIIMQRPDDAWAEKERFVHGVYDLAEDGKIGVAWDSTDCDQCRATGYNILPAVPVAVIRWLDEQYENAEGPFHWNLMSPSQLKDFEPTTRDMALEAFEDGHPHVVYR